MSNRDPYRTRLDVDRARKSLPGFEPRIYLLAKITAAALIGNRRWEYTWSEAWLTGTGLATVPAVKPAGLAGVAYSVSELSNALPTFAYGVVKATLPAGWNAVQIPVETYVFLVPQRADDGTLRWLIVNTQAMDGECQ